MTAAKCRILIAADERAHVEAVTAALRGEFDDIVCSLDHTRLVEDFDRERAPVLVLAFDRILGAERCLIALEQSSESLHAFAHRRLLLCRREDLQRAYALCLQGRFDDYVVFWPADGDARRLSMAVHHAARELHAQALRAQRQLDWVQEAQGLEQLETQLSASATWVLERVEEALRAVEPLRAEGRVAERAARVNAVKTTLDWMRHWALHMGDEWHPVVATARRLRALAARTRPLVLAIDDDEFQHKLLRRMLGDTGVDLLFTTSVNEAMSLLQVRRPDCILMDIGLPDVDGIEAVRVIKSDPHNADLRVVMLTGSRDEAALQRSIDAGASGFIAKPFNRAMLLARLRGLLPADAAEG